MLFNSYGFVFLFFPTVALGYYLLLRVGSGRTSRAWLVAGSLFFYSWWHIYYLPLLLSSILVNYSLFRWLTRVRHGLTEETKPKRRRAKTPKEKRILALALAFNISLLMFFKYVDFFIGNLNIIAGTRIPLLQIVLPLAISFFTLQQIAFQVDAYEGEVDDTGLLDYALFVSFFPQLVAGPIVHHRQMIPQFFDERRLRFVPQSFLSGLWLFVIGLFKKVVVADTFSTWTTNGFDVAPELSFLPAWTVVLCYTFQLYFDFSGYSDMAVGLGRMLNINVPINFNSPLRATSLIEFWNRWHMTLTAFITTYLYYPIARVLPKRSLASAMVATFVSMFIAGFWHGAAWTFVAFGCIHGVGLILVNLTRAKKIKVRPVWGWCMTMFLVLVANAFFRAKSFGDAGKVLSGMFLFNGVAFGREEFTDIVGFVTIDFVLMSACIAAASGVVLLAKNSLEVANNFRPTAVMAMVIAGVFWLSVAHFSTTAPFLYFEF